MNQDQCLCASFKLVRQHNALNAGFELSVDITVPMHGVTAIFGRSGSGKTTLLRLIAGLEKVSDGVMTVNTHVWQDANSFVPTHQRSIGYVFQEPSLFEHLTAGENIEYAIKRCKTPLSQDIKNQVLSILGLSSLLNHYPKQLSGGEQQRVAIARAILFQPALLIMDEPLASLDYQRRKEILSYLDGLARIVKTPIIYVSHSVEEIVRLADHVIVIDQGKVTGQGSVFDVFSQLDVPLGDDKGVVLSGEITEIEQKWQLAEFNFAGASLWLTDKDFQVGQKIRVQIKASDVSITETCEDNSSVLNRLPAVVEQIKSDENQAMALVKLSLGNCHILARLTRKSVANLSLTAGKSVWVQVKSIAIVR